MFNWIGKVWIADKVYLLLMLIVLVIMTVRYKSLDYNLKPLFLFAATHFAMEFGADYLNYATTINNVFLYHFFSPLGYAILCAMFYRTFDEKTLHKSIVLSVVIYFLLAVCYTVFWEPFSQINSLAYMTESIFITYWCFIFFKKTLQREDNYRPENDRMFWVVLSLLVYFIGNFFVVGSINYFVHKKLTLLSYEVYYAGYAFNYLLYITLGVVCLLKFPSFNYD